jgi:hypothetical protein
MILRSSPIATAWARSFAPSFEKMPDQPDRMAGQSGHSVIAIRRVRVVQEVKAQSLAESLTNAMITPWRR